MLISEYKETIKKSKFTSRLYEIKSVIEYENLVIIINKENKKASHICLAVIFEDFEKFKNDGEVGSPAKILMNILKENNLNSHLLVVIREFGGIKLGIGGVQRAFRNVGRECVTNR